MEIEVEKYIYQRIGGDITKYLKGEKYLLNIETGINFPIDTLLLGKVSENILDIIEVGDILKLKDGGKWEVQEHQGDGNWIQTEWEVIENEEDLKSKVDSIVTKEQFSSLEYII